MEENEKEIASNGGGEREQHFFTIHAPASKQVYSLYNTASPPLFLSLTFEKRTEKKPE